MAAASASRRRTHHFVVELRAELLRFPKAWRPDPGDVLIGTVVDVDERSGFAGVAYPIVTVRTDLGDDFVFHAFHTVAKGELARLEPRAGETIGIAYHGPDPDKGYERYRIKVVREQTPGGPDWATMRSEAEADLSDRSALVEPGPAPPASPVDDDIPF
jgi:hypothetical protein